MKTPYNDILSNEEVATGVINGSLRLPDPSMLLIVITQCLAFDDPQLVAIMRSCFKPSIERPTFEV